MVQGCAHGILFTMTVYHVYNKIFFNFENRKATGSESNTPEVEADGYTSLPSSHLHTLVPTVAPALWSVPGDIRAVSVRGTLGTRRPAGLLISLQTVLTLPTDD